MRGIWKCGLVGVVLAWQVTAGPAQESGWGRLGRPTEAFAGLVNERGIPAPILSEVYAILYQGKKPADALMSLMTRELKRESPGSVARTR